MSKKKSVAHVEHKAKSLKEKKPIKKKSPILEDAPQEHYFILCNGQPVKNVKELADALERLEDDVFNHHVTFDRNDFATWIKDIFKDTKLAEDLAAVKDKNNMRIVLYKHLLNHSSKRA
jgi:hypothetical protein